MDDVAVSVVLFPMLLLMMLHSCFDFSTCCASAWKGPAKQVQLLCEICSVSLAASPWRS